MRLSVAQDEYLVVDAVEPSTQEPQSHSPDLELEAIPVAGSVLPLKQLQALVNAFVSTAPAGFMHIADTANLIMEICSIGEPHNTLWNEIEVKSLRRAIRIFDEEDTGYCDWREVVTATLLSRVTDVLLGTPQTFSEAVQVRC